MRRAAALCPSPALECALRTLLAPLDWGDLDCWRAAVNSSVRRLLRADTATFTLPIDGAARIYSDEVEPSALEAYARYYRQLDFGLSVRRPQLGLQVWSRSRLWRRAELLRSEYYQDFALPNRLHDAVGITVELDGPDRTACLSLHRTSRHGARFGKRELARLRALVPALAAGISMRLRLDAHWENLARVLDALRERLLLCDADGRVLHANRALDTALCADPERVRVRAEMEQCAQSLALWRRRGSHDGRSPSVPPVVRELGTRAARYRLRAVLVGDNLAATSCAVLVALDRLSGSSPWPETLRQRFGLTARETAVARHLAEGKSNADVARALGISPHTARHHTESILAKLDAHSRAAILPILLKMKR